MYCSYSWHMKRIPFGKKSGDGPRGGGGVLGLCASSLDNWDKESKKQVNFRTCTIYDKLYL